MKIGILGCAGRMGRTLLREVQLTNGTELSGGLEPSGSEFIGQDLGKLFGEENLGIPVSDDLESFIGESDAVIDFTAPAATITCAEVAARMKRIHVIGTTGLDGDQKDQLANYAKDTTIMLAPNMSIGVNLLLGLVEKVAATLDDSYDIEVLEMHHRHKVDAPSGTSLALGRAAAEGRNVALPDVQKLSREGHTGERPQGEIGFATLRGGDLVGDHSVIFAGEGERIELTHKASDRRIYAKGAVRAALWAKDQSPGLYSMKDVLDLN